MADLARLLSLVPLAFIQLSVAVFATNERRDVEFGPSGAIQLYCCGALTVALAIYLALNLHRANGDVSTMIEIVSWIWLMNILFKATDRTPPPWRRHKSL